MPDNNIIFEPIETGDTPQESQVFKQPIYGDYQSLYEELKARSNPKNFLSPYDPAKATKANELYSLILSTDKQSLHKLKSLRKQVMEELGVKFSTEHLYEKLTKACNPENYTGVFYDKKRFDQANLLYQKVLEKAGTERKPMTLKNWRKLKRKRRI